MGRFIKIKLNIYSLALFHQKKYKKALEMYNKIPFQSEKAKLSYLLLLSGIHKGLGNYKTALELSEKKLEYQDSLHSDESLNQIAFLEYEYENSQLKLEAEKESLRAERNEIRLENSRLQSYGIALISLLFALFALVLYKRYKNQKGFNIILEGKNKEIKNIAGCLIAFACSISFSLNYFGFVSLVHRSRCD